MNEDRGQTGRRTRLNGEPTAGERRGPDPHGFAGTIGSARPAGPVPPAGPTRADRSDDSYDAAEDMVIRPFLLTGGRTKPVSEGLRVETLIHARASVASAGLRFEARQIVQLCREPISLAEISAALRVPFGVARVLVSDLVADGSVVVTQREELSIQLIERIRDRVRAL